MCFRTLRKSSHEKERFKPRPGWGESFVRRVVLLSLVCWVFSASLAFPGRGQTASEYQLKAVFLYNFTKFIEWAPEAFSSDTAPFVVGVLGDDPFGGALDQTVNGKTMNGRPLTVKYLKWGQNMRECQLLFISASERKRLPQILENLRGSSVLTVSDINSFCQQGGIIGLELENNKIGFVINTNIAEQARLRISSKLLSLAKMVLGDRRSGRL
jgi:hypothetical protein